MNIDNNNNNNNINNNNNYVSMNTWILKVIFIVQHTHSLPERSTSISGDRTCKRSNGTWSNPDVISWTSNIRAARESGYFIVQYGSIVWCAESTCVGQCKTNTNSIVIVTHSIFECDTAATVARYIHTVPLRNPTVAGAFVATVYDARSTNLQSHIFGHAIEQFVESTSRTALQTGDIIPRHFQSANGRTVFKWSATIWRC